MPGSRSTISPRPRQIAAHVRRKNGTSLPNSAASWESRSCGQSMPQARLASSSAAAASLDPPPNPAPVGIRLTSSTLAPRLAAAALAEQLERPHDQIRSLGTPACRRHDGPRSQTGRRNAISPGSICPSRRGLKRQRIEQSNGHHQRFQLMEAVGPLVENIQKEIELGGCIYDPLRFVLAEVHPAHHNKAGSNSRRRLTRPNSSFCRSGGLERL